MKKFITRAAVVILIGGMSVAIGGCYGPFRLTSKLHHWNGQVSQKKFVNELVFLGMCIIPAYEICILGDGLIFNSIEWWGGRNPISMEDETNQTAVLLERLVSEIITEEERYALLNDMEQLLSEYDYKFTGYGQRPDKLRNPAQVYSIPHRWPWLRHRLPQSRLVSPFSGLV